MALLLNRRNHDMRLGRLAVPLIGDELRLQWGGTIDVTDSELTTQQLSTLIGTGASAFGEFSDAMKAVAANQATADEAFDKFVAA